MWRVQKFLQSFTGLASCCPWFLHRCSPKACACLSKVNNPCLWSSHAGWLAMWTDVEMCPLPSFMVHLISHNVWHRRRCVIMARSCCNVTHFHSRSWWMCWGLAQSPTVILALEQWAHYFEAQEWKRSNWTRLEWTTKVDYAINSCHCTWSILTDILTRCFVSFSVNKHLGWAIAQ